MGLHGKQPKAHEHASQSQGYGGHPSWSTCANAAAPHESYPRRAASSSTCERAEARRPEPPTNRRTANVKTFRGSRRTAKARDGQHLPALSRRKLQIYEFRHFESRDRGVDGSATANEGAL